MTTATYTRPELNEVITALEAKGMRFELIGEHTNGFWCGDSFVEMDTTYAIELGIEISPVYWVWFTVRGLIDNDVREYWFRQQYNRNTGSVLKSYKTGEKVIAKIENMIGLTLRPY